MTRRQLTEALLFLPAMALLAAAVYAVGWVVIKVGGFLLHAWFVLLADTFALPRPAALALSVMLAAVSVYGLVNLSGRRRRR